MKKLISLLLAMLMLAGLLAGCGGGKEESPSTEPSTEPSASTTTSDPVIRPSDVPYYTGGVDKAISDGFLMRLNEVADQYMANYLKVVYRDEDTFMQCVSDSGNLWGVHCILDRKQGS